MKHRLLFLLLPLTLLFASCANEEEDLKYAIGFQTSDTMLRASEVNDDNILDFRVWSVWTRNASPIIYMDGVKVEREDNTSVWTYSPIFYWPTEGHLDFYAYSPASSSGVISFDAHNGELEYDVTTDLARQEDFVIASMFSPAKNTPVKFKFEHILSKVRFEIENDAVTVKKIEIRELYRKGIYISASETWTGRITPTTYTIPESEYLMVLPQIISGEERIVLTYEIGSEEKSHEYTFSPGFVFKQGESYTIYLAVE